MAEEQPSSADHPNVKAPPPLIFLGALALTWALDHFAHGPKLPGGALVGGIGFFAIEIGILMVLLAFLDFRRAKTNARPWLAATALVPDGIYKVSRNPMYLGMSLTYLGVALMCGSWIMLIGLIPAIATILYGAILPEERYLEAKFGDAYLRYKAAVRRWI